MSTSIHFGKSIRIKGELSGDEDLTVDGRLEGKITLGGHALTIGPNARIKAQVRARSVVVAGELVGNITASDRVEVAATGSMQGDIRAPRVVLADGARFRGSIDMEPKTAAAEASAGATRPSTAAGKVAPTVTGSTSPAKSAPAVRPAK